MVTSAAGVRGDQVYDTQDPRAANNTPRQGFGEGDFRQYYLVRLTGCVRQRASEGESGVCEKWNILV